MSLRVAPAAFGVAACLVLAEPLSAQTQDEGARERPDLVTRPELAVGYALDVIRQGIQIGDVARIGDLLADEYVDHGPDGSVATREHVLGLLDAVVEAAAGRPRPPGLEDLAGVFDFQWTRITVEITPGTAGTVAATAEATGWVPQAGVALPVTVHLGGSSGGWIVVRSEGFIALISAM